MKLNHICQSIITAAEDPSLAQIVLIFGYAFLTIVAVFVIATLAPVESISLYATMYLISSISLLVGLNFAVCSRRIESDSD